VETKIRKISPKKTLGIVIDELMSGLAFSIDVLLTFLVVFPVFALCNTLIVYASHGQVTQQDMVNIVIGLLVAGVLCYWAIVVIIFAVFVPISVITRISFDIFKPRN